MAVTIAENTERSDSPQARNVEPKHKKPENCPEGPLTIDKQHSYFLSKEDTTDFASRFKNSPSLSNFIH
jgi:hypothetical protein